MNVLPESGGCGVRVEKMSQPISVAAARTKRTNAFGALNFRSASSIYSIVRHNPAQRIPAKESLPKNPTDL
jgi:hypothetical protein